MTQITVLLTAILVVLAALMQQVSAAVSTSVANTIVDRHNKYRTKHHAPSLKWDQTLANFAQKWSDGCKFKHSQGPYGENLGLGYQNWTAVVDAWYDEVKDYNYDKPGFSMDTGHFTQVVWKGTTKIGCGVKTCDNLSKGFKLYTCSYSPYGNIVSNDNKYFTENVLEP